MLVKIVTVFLIGIAVLAMFGRLRFPGVPRIGQRKCASCGAPRVGRGACPCGKG
ncbi:hypothetical protein [Jannaschia marina]|uniref:hypothetical protein n=1 Tax=Jannaschia marina TaxID=2741674 RepID=UPI0015CC3943|nr:hypothetical protein [Jannaschia marina]